jgi:hypothetical protein
MAKRFCGWYLVALSLVLLIVSGRLDLIAVLLPLSILFGCGIMRFTGNSKKPYVSTVR